MYVRDSSSNYSLFVMAEHILRQSEAIIDNLEVSGTVSKQDAMQKRNKVLLLRTALEIRAHETYVSEHKEITAAYQKGYGAGRRETEERYSSITPNKYSDPEAYRSYHESRVREKWPELYK